MKKLKILWVAWLFPMQILQAESLMDAAKRGDLSAVTAQVESGVSPNQLDPDDWRETPPLLAAIKSQHIDVVTYLIQHGADCTALDFAGKNALIHAAQIDFFEVVDLLVKCGADIEITSDAYNRTPLVWAVISEHELTAIELVKHGAKTDVSWVHPTKGTTHRLFDTVTEKGWVNLLQ